LQSHVSLKALSAELGYSNRWIQKRHLEVFGISFKQAQGMMRFFQTLHYIALHVKQGKTSLNLTAVAHENGYFDQAHFIKAFKRYAGMTPSHYVTKKFNGEILFYW
jgi:AraC-like DNA-binding protein